MRLLLLALSGEVGRAGLLWGSDPTTRVSSLALSVTFLLGRAGGGGYTRTAVTIIKIPSTDLEQLVVHLV